MSTSTIQLKEQFREFICGRKHEVSDPFFSLLRSEKLNLSQCRALTLLGESQSYSNQGLAEELTLTEAGASRLVEELVERGLAERSANPQDRRGRVVKITHTGRELIERLEEVRFAGIAAFIERLDPQGRQLWSAALQAAQEVQAG